MDTNDNKFFAYLSFVSAVITIMDCIIRTVKATEFTLSMVSIIGLVTFAISIIIYCIVNNVEVYYRINKILSYYMRKKDSYMVKNKECIYSYKSRTEMEYTKKHEIVSNVNNLKHFCDKFKWSKEQKLDEIDIKSDISGHFVSVKRVENWHQYTVEFDELGKGQEQLISITIRNLHDPNKEAMPFLSSNVIFKTRRLRLVVCFRDENLKPINIKYKIFDNYACDFPLIQKDLVFDAIERKVEKVEDYPKYGYRYEISWSFEDD